MAKTQDTSSSFSLSDIIRDDSFDSIVPTAETSELDSDDNSNSDSDTEKGNESDASSEELEADPNLKVWGNRKEAITSEEESD